MSDATQITGTTIAVSIGADTEMYVLVKTNAPKRYDYPTTHELVPAFVDGGDRWVLVWADRLDFQMPRYWSGLYAAEQSDDLPVADIAARLRERLWNGDR